MPTNLFLTIEDLSGPKICQPRAAVGTLTGISAAISTTVIGWIVQHFGDSAGFLTMAAGTFVGVALLWAFLPESKPAEYAD